MYFTEPFPSMAEYLTRHTFHLETPTRVFKTHVDRSAEVSLRSRPTTANGLDLSKTLRRTEADYSEPMLRFYYALKGDPLHVGSDIGEVLRWRELPNVTRGNDVRKKSSTKT